MRGPKIFLYTGLGAIGGSCFVATAYWTAISYAPAPSYTVSDYEREQTWEKIAPTYFNSVKSQEFYLGIRNMRRKLARECRGDVLEVGAGSGTMVGMYPSQEKLSDDEVMTSRASEGKSHKKAEGTDVATQILDKTFINQKLEKETYAVAKKHSSTGVRQVIMGDRAGGMLKELEEKIQGRLGFAPHRISDDEAAKWNPSSSSTLRLNSDVETNNYKNNNQNENNNEITKTKSGTIFNPAAANPETLGPLIKTNDGEKHPLYQTSNFSAEAIPFPDNSFDTVVDIFGLCSYDDPVRALMEMSRVCKPDGQILLLEHGKGHWNKINMQLDKWAPRHAKSWGCWWNRDHRRYLRLAGLKTVKREVKHFGTTQKMVVKPNKNWMPECKHIECHTSNES